MRIDRIPLVVIGVGLSTFRFTFSGLDWFNLWCTQFRRPSSRENIASWKELPAPAMPMGTLCVVAAEVLPSRCPPPPIAFGAIGAVCASKSRPG